MRRLPFISSMCYLPLGMVNARKLEKELTIRISEPPVGSDLYQSIVGESEDGDKEYIVKLYTYDKRGYIGVPRSFGLSRFSEVDWVNRLTNIEGKPKRFPQEIVARDRNQERFMDELANVCTNEYPVDAIANARTGSGKTVTDLWLTAKLGKPTLVIVHTNALKRQWIGSIEKKHGIKYFYGEDWCEKYVGIAQQDICDFLGRRIVIGLLPSLVRRDYGRDFYRYFGKVTIDEIHKAAAPQMSEVLKKFSAEVRIGYTATNRRDVLKKVCDMHLGEPKVISYQKVAKPKVFVYSYKAETNLSVYNGYTIITSISELTDRNKFIAKIIRRGWKKQKNIIVFSDRIKQLQYLKRYLINEFHIPENEVGIYAGRRYTGNYRARVRSDDKVVYSEKGFISNRVAIYGAKKWINENGQAGMRYTLETEEVAELIKKEELEEVITNCTIILATYGIFDTGIDVPRLDFGVEATPRANVDQALGRILRIKEGKDTPVWISVRDFITLPGSMLPANSQELAMFDKYYRSRLKSYKRQTANVRVV